MIHVTLLLVRLQTWQIRELVIRWLKDRDSFYRLVANHLKCVQILDWVYFQNVYNRYGRTNEPKIGSLFIQIHT